ncbi:hypothetical protein GYMLUDRAFT_250127 [Collybiopsis luxurians FD-317 M1]|uniref:Uncharacterized protein n=1 Tax=Collybiopsis luxurians FD-317 M1 TaxID=944289 RepID=A0A0D0BVW1_9AGAR|nr:hypothetical protein GYMLUDRAFT_250127 [Collybiopsis luxurians FD-317 M1]
MTCTVSNFCQEFDLPYLSAPTNILNPQLQIEQEIAQLESQINVQTLKLATAWCNNIKQIQWSITSRQEKVEKFKLELAQICKNNSSTTETEQGVKLRQASLSLELSGFNSTGEEHVSEVDIASPSKGTQLIEDPMSEDSKDKVEAITGDNPFLNSQMDRAPEVSSVSSQNHPLAKHRVDNFTRDNALVSSQMDGGSQVPMASLQTCPLASPIIQSEDVRCDLNRRSNSSLLKDIGEWVGEILDSAIARHPPLPSLPAKGINIYSGTGLSKGAQDLMIGWKYTRYWLNIGSTDSYSGANLTILNASTLVNQAACLILPVHTLLLRQITMNLSHLPSLPHGDMDTSHKATTSNSLPQGGTNTGTNDKTEPQESKEVEQVLLPLIISSSSLVPHSSSEDVPLEQSVPSLATVVSTGIQNAHAAISQVDVYDPPTPSPSAGVTMLKAPKNLQSGGPASSVDPASAHCPLNEKTSYPPLALSTPDPMSQSHGERALSLPQAPKSLTNILSSTGGISHRLRELMKSAAKWDNEEVSEVRSEPLAPMEKGVGQSDKKHELAAAELAPKRKRKWVTQLDLGEFNKEDFPDLADDNESDTEFVKKMKRVSKKKKENEPEYDRCLQLARDNCTIEKAHEKIKVFLEDGTKFSRDIKYLLRTGLTMEKMRALPITFENVQKDPGVLTRNALSEDEAGQKLFNGKVGNVCPGDILALSPNASYLFYPPQICQVRLRCDYHFGIDDPLYFPQPFSSDSAHLALMLCLSRNPDDRFYYAWFTPSDDQFCVIDSSLEIGRLDSMFYEGLSALCLHVLKEVPPDADDVYLTSLATNLRRLLTRLDMPGTLQRTLALVAQIQRTALELNAQSRWVGAEWQQRLKDATCHMPTAHRCDWSLHGKPG